MRILVLSTASGIDTRWVRELRDSLPVEDADLCLVAVTRPAERLPVTRCLVVGPSLRPRRWVADTAVEGRARRGAPKPSARRRRLMRRLDRASLRLLPGGRRKDRALMLSTGTVWSAAVREEFAAADLVIAHDYNATWAAWQLARRLPDPDVVFQTEGAVLKLAERAERDQQDERGSLAGEED